MDHSGRSRISLHFGTLWPGLHCYLAKFPSFTFFLKDAGDCFLHDGKGDHDGKIVLLHPVPSWRNAEGYAIWGIIENGARGFLGGLTGWMGVMSLIEAGPGLDAWNMGSRCCQVASCIHNHISHVSHVSHKDPESWHLSISISSPHLRGKAHLAAAQGSRVCNTNADVSSEWSRHDNWYWNVVCSQHRVIALYTFSAMAM